mmetsp:Transcript_12362/g.22377  ORF Transcript_12362/g.22377 Transcript_12362/m.22377 type:complete len:402 (-) Transcript_12362:23-1228(-)
MLHLLPVAIVGGIEPLLVRPEHGPIRRVGDVILHTKFECRIGGVPRRQLLEPVVVDPSLPLALTGVFWVGDRELIHAGEEHAARVLVLACQVILRQRIVSSLLPDGVQFLEQHFGKVDDLVVPGRVAHVEVGRVGFTAECYSLHFHEGAVAQGDEAGVAADFVGVPALDHREARDGALSLAFKAGQGRFEAVPCIAEQGTVNCFQAFRRRRIHADIQLGNRNQILNRLRMLSIRHQIRRNLPLMQLTQQLINMRIHDRLPHQTQRAVPHGMRIMPSIHLYSGYSPRLLDQIHMSIHRRLHDHLRIVRLPPPFPPHGILVMTPAEDALVRARQGGGGFHALVGGDAVVRVFVASSAAAELVFGPAAEFDGGVGADELVPFLLEGLGLFGGDHLLRFFGFLGG